MFSCWQRYAHNHRLNLSCVYCFGDLRAWYCLPQKVNETGIHSQSNAIFSLYKVVLTDVL